MGDAKVQKILATPSAFFRGFRYVCVCVLAFVDEVRLRTLRNPMFCDVSYNFMHALTPFYQDVWSEKVLRCPLSRSVLAC